MSSSDIPRIREDKSSADAPALPWGIDANQLKPGAMKTISDDKLATFVIGRQKKTKFQRDKEEREAKKKKAEEEAAKVYEQFVASFEDDTTGKSFVRGETLIPVSEKSDAVVSTRLPGASYVLSAPTKETPSSSSSSSSSSNGLSGVFQTSNNVSSNTELQSPITKPGKKVSEMEMMLQEMKCKEIERQSSKGGSSKRKREIDDFLEEMKVRAQAPEEDNVPEVKGSHDMGDASTTNLYVGNLSPNMTEEALESVFGRFGKVYSVKVMWPRSDEERSRKRNCGFVSFYSRKDAEDAKATLEDTEIDGHQLFIGWGKAVKMETTDVSNAVPSNDNRNSGGKWDKLPGLPERERLMDNSQTKIHVKIPSDRSTLDLINRLARYVARDGNSLESRIKEREEKNSKYTFLFDLECIESIYYRWKVYSLIMGDKEDSWKETPFQLVVGGETWIPPSMEEVSRLLDKQSSRKDKYSDDEYDREREKDRDRSRERSRDHWRYRDSSGSRSRHREKDRSRDNEKYMTGQQLARARDRERGREKHRLGNREYEEFSDMLRRITIERQSIKEAMGFALDNAEAACEVVEIIQESLAVKDAPPPVKVARFYVISDILHNSTAPVKNASSYRTLFQECLPQILEYLNIAYKSIDGRMSARTMQEKVLNVLKVWEQWSLFPPLYLTGLNATFLMKESLILESIPADVTLSREDLRRKCEQAGLVSTGTPEELYSRLNNLKKFSSDRQTREIFPEEVKQFSDALSPRDNHVSVTSPNEFDKDENYSEEDIDGKPIDGTPLEEDEDIDGAPLEEDEDIDGAPLEEEEDIDGAPMEEEEENIDGAPMEEEEENIDGAPMEEEEEDIDGAPMDAGFDNAPLGEDEDIDGQPIDDEDETADANT